MRFECPLSSLSLKEEALFSIKVNVNTMETQTYTLLKREEGLLNLG